MGRELSNEDDQHDPFANFEPQDEIAESSDSETDYGSSLATRVWKLSNTNDEFASIDEDEEEEEEEEDKDTSMEFEGFDGFGEDSDFETIRRKMRKPTQLFGLNTITEEMIESTLDEIEQDLKRDFSSDDKVIIFKSKDPLQNDHDDDDQLTSPLAEPPSIHSDHRRSHAPHIEKTAKEKRKQLKQLIRDNSDTLQRLFIDKAEKNNKSSHPIKGRNTVFNIAMDPNTDFDVEVKLDNEKVHVLVHHKTNPQQQQQQQHKPNLIKRLFKSLLSK